MVKIFCWALFFTAAIILAVSSCKQDIDKDNSLTITEYRKSGMPDPDKIWHSHDFTLAFAVLENIKSSQPYNLPIKESNKSGRIFSKILSLDNMEFMNDESIPNELEIRLSENFLRVCENLIRIYTMPTHGQQYYHRELTDAYLFGLEVSDVMLTLNDEVKSTEVLEHNEIIDNANPVQSIYLSGLFNLLRAQNQASQSSESDHKLIVECVSQSIEKNQIWFDENVEEDLRKAFKLISDSTALKQFRVDYSNLIGVL